MKAKELYAELRHRSWPELWETEVPRFERATGRERQDLVAVVRAVGVVFLESGDASKKKEVQEWLVGLLQDPDEKVRRYAMAALPKIGGGNAGESKIVSIAQSSTTEREKIYAARALEKLGGTAALRAGLSPAVEQKIKASLARESDPSAVSLEARMIDFQGIRIHLRGRRGLEQFVHEEARSLKSMRISRVADGLVVLIPTVPFSLGDLYRLRCFSTVGFALEQRGAAEDLISSPASLRVLKTFTRGQIRYRLHFVDKGHQRGAVRQLAEAVYRRCPEILNDPRSVTWTADLRGDTLEWRPNLTPDPRFSYRLRDMPAASHPQLAAAMARLGGAMDRDVVWDPFCGTGSELVECALLGKVAVLHGTDLSEPTIEIAHENIKAAGVTAPLQLHVADFRDYAKRVLKPESVSLILTNPPLGIRVQAGNVRELLTDLLDVATTVLKPGGRLVFAHPLARLPVPPGLRLEINQAIDFGGFDCRFERYVKVAPPAYRGSGGR